jgi:hypothetical protein
MSSQDESITQLRAFVLHDLEIMALQEEGVNYAAGLVVLAA